MKPESEDSELQAVVFFVLLVLLLLTVQMLWHPW